MSVLGGFLGGWRWWGEFFWQVTLTRREQIGRCLGGCGWWGECFGWVFGRVGMVG